MSLSNVVLPEPELPTTPMRSPLRTSRETSESAPLPASGSTETGHYRTIELPPGRSFMAHVPDNYDPTKPAPVVKRRAASM